MDMTLLAICERVKGQLVGDGATLINGISASDHTQSGHLTLAEDAPHLARALASAASAVLVSVTTDLQGRPGIRLSDPKRAFSMLLGLFYPEPILAPGIHKSAVLGENVRLGADVTIGANAVIEDGVVIGRGTRVGAGVYLGHEVILGEDCTLYPNVTIYRRTEIGNRVSIHSGSVIGGDGFGYTFSQGAYQKVPQTGNVIIEQDVEIGCNSCVDRSTVGSTIIREGTKIDNLVQVAHNNDIGRHVALAGQVGLAGSVTVGDYTQLGGKVGVVDHITIGQGVKAGAGTLVIKSIASGKIIWGVPAREARQTKRQLALLSRLPELLKRWLGLEGLFQRQAERLDRLEQQLKIGVSQAQHTTNGGPNGSSSSHSLQNLETADTIQ